MSSPSLFARLGHALGKPFRRARYRKLKAGLGTVQNKQSVFEEIYEHNLWSDLESRSGPGSTMAYTASLRAALERVLAENGVRTFLDAPCGDFHWMRAVKTPPGMRYIGGDIVPALIADTKARHGDDRHDFIHLDITKGPLPAVDMWMCRDCFFHLSYADIARALQQFVRADIPLLLLTTHIVPKAEPFANRNINTGDARPIDLRSDPFSFPEPLERFDDWVAPFAPREMGLWTREQMLPVAERLAVQFLAAESATTAP
ncbi:MAG: class I SAM-dependent methyltransferase [Hyphomonadaceae bacterium]|nr:MAG: hypothetical protein FD160_1133 [Caulobacteraceae bacterium]MBT9444387.1 class I SAM-dependent methyltransferase [Hyphomonadaceae bacterium]TPW05657.1 MAG: hypothetical protein FD124_2081 [Alphaproteobacteria bacterium]